MTPRRQPQPRADAALAFNVSTLLSEPIGGRRDYALSDAPFVFDGFPTPVSGQLRFLRTDGSIMVGASLSLHLPETCSDCLEPYRSALSLRFEEEFWPPYDHLTQRPVEVPQEREGFPIVDGHLDLRDAVRQYVEMARPMRPQCGPACPGPAGPVGREPPAQEGQEPESPGDSRWVALQGLRDTLR